MTFESGLVQLRKAISTLEFIIQNESIESVKTEYEGKLKELSALLQRPRTRAHRHGLSDYESDVALAAEIDFSLWALFARATITVKIVMILLVIMSIWAWAITIQKLITYRAARAELAKFETLFWSGQALDDLYDALGPQPGGARK